MNIQALLKEMVARMGKNHPSSWLPFTAEESKALRAHHNQQALALIPDFAKSGDCLIVTRSATVIALGFDRLVVGDYGAYIEMNPKQIVRNSIGQRWPGVPNRLVKYIWMESADESKVKVYKQCRTVRYADYKIGMYYVSPHDVSFIPETM